MRQNHTESHKNGLQKKNLVEKLLDFLFTSAPNKQLLDGGRGRIAQLDQQVRWGCWLRGLNTSSEPFRLFQQGQIQHLLSFQGTTKAHELDLMRHFNQVEEKKQSLPQTKYCQHLSNTCFYPQCFFKSKYKPVFALNIQRLVFKLTQSSSFRVTASIKLCYWGKLQHLKSNPTVIWKPCQKRSNRHSYESNYDPCKKLSNCDCQ